MHIGTSCSRSGTRGHHMVAVGQSLPEQPGTTSIVLVRKSAQPSTGTRGFAGSHPQYLLDEGG